MSVPDPGRIRPITRWGAPVMHHRLALVERFDDDLATLVADMVATMRAADGVGLAANQLGVDLAVFVFDCPDEDDVLVSGVVCNPVLTLPEGKDRELDDSEEGCLSLPGAYAPCGRPSRSHVEGVDHTGRPVSYDGTGLLARCLQHETDHTAGMVFADRLANRARRRLMAEAEELADQFDDDWPVTAGPSDED